MPYIESKFSKKLSQDEIISLKSGFGKAIECIPGKSEFWLMVNIEDDKNIFFKGNNDADSAFISVAIFGTAKKSDYDNLTNEICTLINNTTGISKERTYITYSEMVKWGWNSNNF